MTSPATRRQLRRELKRVARYIDRRLMHPDDHAMIQISHRINRRLADTYLMVSGELGGSIFPRICQPPDPPPPKFPGYCYYDDQLEIVGAMLAAAIIRYKDRLSSLHDRRRFLMDLRTYLKEYRTFL